MDLGEFTEDQLDQLLIRAESEVAGWRSIEMAVVAEKKRRQSYNADGYRSIVDWVAARADVSHQTARSICWTASRLAEAPEVAAELALGGLTFDRAEQLARLPETQRRGHEGYDIAQLRRKVALHRRLTPRRERATGGYLHLQPSLDETTTHFWGELPGLDARILEKAIEQRADEIIPSEARLPVAERRALALVAICQDSLYGETETSPSPATEVVVTIDARTAAADGGQTGVAVLGGTRLGPRALEEVICNARVDLIGITQEGRPLALGRRSRVVSRRLRRHVMERDMGCTVEGCTSRYRLEVHHEVPWSRGGRTDPESLLTLCWFHHHVAVHREGLVIERTGTSRVRLKRPT